MPQISIPTINWGKRKERSQMNEIFTYDGRIITKELPVDRACMDDENTGQSFLLDSSNQFKDADDPSGPWFQILSEGSTIPICLINESNIDDLWDLIKKIFHESKEREQMRMYWEAAKAEIADKMAWMVTIIVCGAMVIFAIYRFTGG